MALLRGKTFVTCPQTGQDVKVQVDCVKCSSFKHVSYESFAILYVTCSYGEKQETAKE